MVSLNGVEGIDILIRFWHGSPMRDLYPRKEVFMHSLCRRLFLGFDLTDSWLLVVALTGWGEVLLKTRFPFSGGHPPWESNSNPLEPIAQSLAAFIRSCSAEAVCASACDASPLKALAHLLDSPLKIVDPYDFNAYALAGHDPIVRREIGLDAHHRATLAALAAAVPQEVLE